MFYFQSYLLVGYLMVMSSAAPGRHSDASSFHGDQHTDVTVAPPTFNGLIIDCDGCYGNKDDVNLEKPSGSPDHYSDLAGNPGDPTINDVETTTISSEQICSILCRRGEGGTACMCDWPPKIRKLYFLSIIDMQSDKYRRQIDLVRKWFKMKKFNPVRTDNEDTSPPTLNPEELCDYLCRNGEGGNACMCDWAP